MDTRKEHKNKSRNMDTERHSTSKDLIIRLHITVKSVEELNIAVYFTFLDLQKNNEFNN